MSNDAQLKMFTAFAGIQAELAKRQGGGMLAPQVQKRDVSRPPVAYVPDPSDRQRDQNALLKAIFDDLGKAGKSEYIPHTGEYEQHIPSPGGDCDADGREQAVSREKAAQLIHKSHRRSTAQPLEKLFAPTNMNLLEASRRHNAQASMNKAARGMFAKAVTLPDQSTDAFSDGGEIADTGGSRPSPIDNGFPTGRATNFLRPSSRVENSVNPSTPESAAGSAESGQQDDSLEVIKRMLKQPPKDGRFLR